LYFYVNRRNFSKVVFPDQLSEQDLQEYRDYIRSKQKFINFVMPHRKKLINDINSSYNRNIYLWQIPKGRIIPGESQLECAVREVREETGIEPHQYDLLLDSAPPIHDVKERGGVIYRHIYYVGVMKSQEPIYRLNYNNKCEYVEVTDIKPVPLGELRSYITNDDLIEAIKGIKRLARNYIRRRKRYDLSEYGYAY
jgi:8-oxo-dGTP pyrophosphatase MutT (NUDIX family)